MKDEHLSDFIWNCRRVIEHKGSDEPCPEIGIAAIGWQFAPNKARSYKDDRVLIVCEAEPSPAILVTRIQGHDPVLCINRTGVMVRPPGNYMELAPHVARLCRQALASHLIRMGAAHAGYSIVSTAYLLALQEVAKAASNALVDDKGTTEDVLQALEGIKKCPMVE